MKHTLSVTAFLVLIFFISQVVGLAVVNQYIDYEKTEEVGEVVYEALPYDMERPPIEEKSSFVFIMAAVLIGTLIVLLLIKFRKPKLWKAWFFFAVTLTLAISLSAFMPQYFALSLAILFAALKIFRPNVIIHNLTEIFIYGGLAAIFVPVMNLFAAIALLVLISIYDAYAVWKSKHMVKMADFQTKSNIFAGLFIPYGGASMRVKKTKIPKPPKKGRIAILGGGDIGFPLLFAGVVMKGLMMSNIFWIGFLKSLIIPLFATVALSILFIKSEKDKFYPAMPFITAGCLLGYAAVILVNLI